MKHETLFLKAAVVFIGIPVLGLCIFALPGIAVKAMEIPGYLRYPFVMGMYGTAMPFFFALYQALKLLSYIDANKAFSELSVQALRNIKYCGVAVSIFYSAGLPLLCHVAEVEDAPGLVLFGLVIPFVSVVVAVFAAVLQKLLKNAIDIKAENDLTV
jgi:hypothetical protein